MRGEKVSQGQSAAAHPSLSPPPQTDLGNPELAAAKVPHSQKTLQEPQWEQKNLVLADGASLVDRV